MPKFLETKLKKEYGAKSSIPYKVMNSIGAMKGNKETAKGKAMEKKHLHDEGIKTHHNSPVTHHHEHGEDGKPLHTPFHDHEYYGNRHKGSLARKDGHGLTDNNAYHEK